MATTQPSCNMSRGVLCCYWRQAHLCLTMYVPLFRFWPPCSIATSQHDMQCSRLPRQFADCSCAFVQILEEQRALLEAAPDARAQPRQHRTDSRGAASSVPRQPKDTRTTVSMMPGRPTVDCAAAAAVPGTPPSGHEEVAADWHSLRRSLDQLALGLPAQDDSTRQQEVVAGQQVGNLDVVAAGDQDKSCRGAVQCSHADADVADMAIRIAGMRGALAAKEAELVRNGTGLHDGMYACAYQALSVAFLQLTHPS